MSSTNPGRDEILAALSVTRAEAAIFTAIHYGLTASPAILPGIAAREDYDPQGRVVTEEECEAALAACLAKGWLQVIDEPALARISDDLRNGGFIGPIYGLPVVGGVDFTDAGTALWHRICGRCCSDPAHRPFAFTDVVHIKTAHYFRTKAAALASIEEAGGQDDGVSITGPVSIGAWRAQWWRRFADGYRVDIEEKMQWQGRAGGGTDHCILSRRSLPKTEPQRLQRILDCHNVTVAQWLILASMDRIRRFKSAARLPAWVAASAKQEFGLIASEEECRIGLESCLRFGWLRIVDQQAVDEVQALLRNDPTVLPVPSQVEPKLGEVDFTQVGAALYRMIADEWFGPDWENAISVRKETYRQEHRYCESQEGFVDMVGGPDTSGEVVRASRIVQIGPWCVYWWNRLPAGYRLELEIGEP